MNLLTRIHLASPSFGETNLSNCRLVTSAGCSKEDLVPPGRPVIAVDSRQIV